MEKETLENRLKELSNEFDAVNLQIESAANKYNKELQEREAQMKAELKKLKDEGQALVDSLSEKREQVRGAYTEILHLLHPELNVESGSEKVIVETSVKEPDEKQAELFEELREKQIKEEQVIETEDIKQEVVEESVEKENNEEVVQEVETINLAKLHQPQSTITEEESKLLAEEIEKLQQAQREKEVDDNKDIPEYLKDEYKK